MSTSRKKSTKKPAAEKAAGKREELLQKLLELEAEDPTLFGTVVHFDLPAEYQRRRDAAHAESVERLKSKREPEAAADASDRSRGGQRKWHPEFTEAAWVRVEFLMWRDGIDARAACQRLTRNGFRWKQWRTDSAESMRVQVSRFRGLSDEERWSGEHMLQHLKDSHDEKPGGWPKLIIDRMFPPV